MKWVLAFLLLVTFYGCYHFFSKLLFADNNLVVIQGQLKTKFIETVNYSTSHHKPIKCLVLGFGLKDDKRIYCIKLNIDSVYQGFNALEGVNQSLENAGQIKVWIKKADFSLLRPKVYTLSTDDKIIYDQLQKPESNLRLYTKLAFLLLLFTAIYYLLKYYDTLLVVASR